MSKSPNLNLTLTAESESAKKFLQWRKEMAGTDSDSNLMILDTVIAELMANKADKDEAIIEWDEF